MSTSTKDVANTPMTPEGREASSSGDEEMGESFELMDRDKSLDDIRYTPVRTAIDLMKGSVAPHARSRSIGQILRLG